VSVHKQGALPQIRTVDRTYYRSGLMDFKEPERSLITHIPVPEKKERESTPLSLHGGQDDATAPKKGKG